MADGPCTAHDAVTAASRAEFMGRRREVGEVGRGREGGEMKVVEKGEQVKIQVPPGNHRDKASKSKVVPAPQRQC